MNRAVGFVVVQVCFLCTSWHVYELTCVRVDQCAYELACVRVDLFQTRRPHGPGPSSSRNSFCGNG